MPNISEKDAIVQNPTQTLTRRYMFNVNIFTLMDSSPLSIGIQCLMILLTSVEHRVAYATIDPSWQ